MKTVSKLICTAGLVGMAATASAQVFSWTENASIPDGDLNGVTFVQPVSIAPGTRTVDVNSFRVYLNITGDPVGGNGDLFIYLRAPDGTIAQLVNRPGYTGSNSTGYQDNGLNVTLFDGTDPSRPAGYSDIHLYQTDPVYGGIPGNDGLTGIFKSDGRDVDPLSAGTAFDAAARTRSLSVFQGIDPAGDWSLFAADVSSGGNSKLNAWGLDFTPIPEPQSYAMAIGAGLMAFALYRRRMLKSA